MVGRRTKMSTNYLSGSETLRDHDLTLAIPGDVEAVRLRLIKAVNALGYKVLGEQPVYAKRASQGSARWDSSLNVLDYPTTLTVSLKQMNEVAVVATFNYEIKSFMCMTKGDRQTLRREAEALASLATERHAISACSSCGTQVTDESHFCRRCGAPLVLEAPELEILRLTRGSRSSYHNIFVGVIGLFLAALTILPIFLVNGARIWAPLMWVGISLGIYALFMLIQGAWQLHRTLNPKTLTQTVRPQPAFTTAITTALPLTSVTSVTERTTELFFSTKDQRVAEPIPREDADTAEIDDDRLM